jgi:hypothetical protein
MHVLLNVKSFWILEILYEILAPTAVIDNALRIKL